MTSKYKKPVSGHQPADSGPSPGSAPKDRLGGRRALLLSSYDAASHRHWRQSLCALFPQVQWTQLALPARYFSWRVRGNSLSWAFNHRAVLTDNYDFLLVTSMTDLSSLRGFVPQLSSIPTAVYFHENQFAYPASDRQFKSVEPLILNLYTALCADELVFNSQYNRQTFLEGVDALLRKLPDHVPAGLVDRLSQAQVLPVPLDDGLFKYAAESPVWIEGRAVFDIVWNHRWEYDKGPELLLQIIRRLVAAQLHFRLHVLGEKFRSAPAQFAELKILLDAHYQATQIPPGVFGFISDRQEYYTLLAQADVVLSTARHDFQGLALLEGIALGCTPLAPDRLAYPEYLDNQQLLYRGRSMDEEAEAAAARLLNWAQLRATRQPLPRACVQRFRSSRLTQAYRSLLERLCTRPPEHGKQ